MHNLPLFARIINIVHYNINVTNINRSFIVSIKMVLKSAKKISIIISDHRMEVYLHILRRNPLMSNKFRFLCQNKTEKITHQSVAKGTLLSSAAR